MNAGKENRANPTPDDWNARAGALRLIPDSSDRHKEHLEANAHINEGIPCVNVDAYLFLEGLYDIVKFHYTVDLLILFVDDTSPLAC